MIYSGYKQQYTEKRTDIRNTRTHEEGRLSGYLARRNEDLVQGTTGLVQGIHQSQEPDVKILPLHALGSIIEREKNRRWVLSCNPLERRLTPDNRAGDDLLRVLSTTVMTPGDPLATSSCIRPAPGAAA